MYMHKETQLLQSKYNNTFQIALNEIVLFFLIKQK